MKQKRNQEMSFAVAQALILLATTLSISLIISNLLALKIWNLAGIPVDAGILAFPISYVAGDLLVEIYGQKLADRIATFSAGFALILAALVNLAGLLPDFPGANNSGFTVLRLSLGRIFIASVVAFLLSQWCNNYFFDQIRHRWHRWHREITPTEAPTFWRTFAKRALVSSSLAHLVDSLVFECLAFYGKLPLQEFLVQAGFAYVAGFALEILFFPVTYALANSLRQRLAYSDGHHLVR